MKKRQKNRIKLLMTLGVIAVVIFLGVLVLAGNQAAVEENHNHKSGEVKETESTEWTCSMHPQIRRDEPGQCPICAMDLIPVDQQSASGTHPDAITLTDEAVKLADIQTTEVRHGVLHKTLHLTGKISVDERREFRISARFPGRFDRLTVNETGQMIREGDILGTVYSAELISAHRELIEAVKQKETNPSAYQSARKKLDLWNFSEDQIEKLEKQEEPATAFHIRSDRSGVVLKRHIQEGDYVKEGSPLFDGVNLSKVWVLFDVYEKDLPFIQMGRDIMFSVEGFPGEHFAGTVTFMDPVVDAQKRVVKIRAEVTNDEIKLRPGQFVRGFLKSKETEGLIVPRSAILWTGKRSVVYVKEPNHSAPSFMMREVVPGAEVDHYVVITEGLQKGEIVVSQGVFRVDAAAQLAGKPGMMSPEDGMSNSGHDHGMISKPMKSNEKKEQDMTKEEIRHETFKISGLCGMCKDRIEKTTLSLNGVIEASWSAETQILDIRYNPAHITLQEVHKAVAAVGHDTELEKAPDEVYEALPACCLYR